MDKILKTETKNSTVTKIKWTNHDFGLIEACLVNGELNDFRACKSGSLITFMTSDIEFLKVIHEAIGDVLKEAKETP